MLFFFYSICFFFFFFFFSSRRRHTRWTGDWSSDVCSSDLRLPAAARGAGRRRARLGRRDPSLIQVPAVGLLADGRFSAKGAGALPLHSPLRVAGAAGGSKTRRSRAPRRSCMVLPALDGKTRCRWAATDPILAAYHDSEWGEPPPLGEAGWFERLSLEV